MTQQSLLDQPRARGGRPLSVKPIPRGSDPALRCLIQRMNEYRLSTATVEKRSGTGCVKNWLAGETGRIDLVRAALNAVDLDLIVVCKRTGLPVAIPATV